MDKKSIQDQFNFRMKKGKKLNILTQQQQKKNTDSHSWFYFLIQFVLLVVNFQVKNMGMPSSFHFPFFSSPFNDLFKSQMT